jgi:hypothetical protein
LEKTLKQTPPYRLFYKQMTLLDRTRDFVVSQFTVATSSSSSSSSELHFSIFLPRGRFTMKLMKLKFQGPFQGPERGPSNLFTWSYVFVKFAKVKYFNHNRFSLLSLSTSISPLAHLPWSQVVLE